LTPTSATAFCPSLKWWEISNVWDFALVVSFIKARNNALPDTSDDDPYIKGIRRAPTA